MQDEKVYDMNTEQNICRIHIVNHSFHELHIQMVKFVQFVNYNENTLFGHPFREMDNTYIVYFV